METFDSDYILPEKLISIIGACSVCPYLIELARESAVAQIQDAHNNMEVYGGRWRYISIRDIHTYSSVPEKPITPCHSVDHHPAIKPKTINRQFRNRYHAKSRRRDRVTKQEV